MSSLLVPSPVSIPDFQTIMLPLLEFASDGLEHTLADAIEHLAIHFKLTDAERKELLPSGKQPIFDNRVGWARTHLKKAVLLTYPSRGKFQITQRGVDLLKTKPRALTWLYSSNFLNTWNLSVQL